MSEIDLKRQIENLSQKTDRILYYLDNDPHTGRKGLYQEVAEIREDVSNIVEREKILKAKVSAFGVAGGALAFLLSKGITILLAILK